MKFLEIWYALAARHVNIADGVFVPQSYDASATSYGIPGKG
jgi:hypothetical protein